MWATAIGLAAAQAQGEMHRVEHWCRNGGGKGPFQGASGLVSFDERGERDVRGLVYVIYNVQGPPHQLSEEEWRGFVFRDHWAVLGTFEDRRGFEAAPGLVPYWPGGLRGWSAPPDRVDAAAAPSAPPTPTIVREVIVNGASQLVIGISAGVVAGVLVLACLWVRSRGTDQLDAEEESLRQCASELRQTLQITQQDGYIVSTEKILWARSHFVIIPKAQMDAAVRLMRREDFDIDAFDAFCVLVADEEYAASDLRGFRRRSSREAIASADIGVADLEHNTAIELLEPFKGKLQLRLLRRWLLDCASRALAELSIGKLASSPEQHRDLSRRDLFKYFSQKLMNVRLFRDDACSLFKELKTHAQVFGNQVAFECNKRVRDIANEPGGSELCSFVFSPDKGIFIPEAADLKLLTGCRGREEVAGDSAAAKNALVLEDKTACTLAQDDAKEILFIHSAAQPPILRQDDARVGAVQTSSTDLLERAMEGANPHLCLQYNEHGLRIDSSESVSGPGADRQG